MPEKSSLKRPRMRKGDCVDLLSGKPLPLEDCLTKRGKSVVKTNPHKTMVVNDVTKDCVWVNPTIFKFKGKLVSKKGFWSCSEIGEK